jgi:hypothetical protein
MPSVQRPTLSDAEV